MKYAAMLVFGVSMGLFCALVLNEKNPLIIALVGFFSPFFVNSIWGIFE